MTRPSPSPYALYELSVQSPWWHVDWFDRLFRGLRGRSPHTLREDFCGTFRLSSEWVKHSEQNHALGLDLDPGPLQYGKQNHWKPLKPAQRKRLRAVEQDVLIPTREKFDIIAACNFSFNIFKQRAVLLRYFRACLDSLNADGVLLLEAAGGPGMIGEMRERRTVRAPGLGLRGGKFQYTWHQRSFDPITHDVLYSIHFKLPDGTQMRDAFVYDWRLWSLPELKDLLLEAGFSDVRFYWESEHAGEGTGEYLPATRGGNDYAWIAYVVGVR